MPPFVVVPARPDDIEVIARLQFEACADDPGFQTIFPKGGTPRSVQHAVLQLEEQMNEDTTAHFMIVKDGMTGEVASFAIWHFCPARGQEEIEAEMLKDDFGPWPLEANIQAANKLVHNASRKRYEVVEKWFGAGAGHACERDPLKAATFQTDLEQICPPWARPRSIANKVPLPCS